MDEVFADEQVQHLDMVALDVIRNPVSMDGITTVRTAAGERPASVEEVLRRVGVTDTGTEQLLCDVDEGIALVTFNNPDQAQRPVRPDPRRVARACCGHCRPTTPFGSSC